MTNVSVTKALSGYFNEGEGKRRPTQFLAELKALSAEEKRELAELVVEVTGDTLDPVTPASGAGSSGL